MDYGVIRGLAYYTGVVFEAFDRKGDFRAIAGGGRYDNLVALLSGGKANLPALGFGMGDVVLMELLKARQRLPRFNCGLDAFCLIEDETLQRDSLKLIQDLRAAGVAVDYPLTPAKPDKQFKRAQEAGTPLVCKHHLTPPCELMVRVTDLKTRGILFMPPAKQLAVLQAFRGIPIPRELFLTRIATMKPGGAQTSSRGGRHRGGLRYIPVKSHCTPEGNCPPAYSRLLRPFAVQPAGKTREGRRRALLQPGVFGD